MSETRQVEVTYHGRVQGVGFRFTVVRLSQRFEVTGCVRNCRDGTVQLVAEGSEETLRRFLASILASSVGGFITRHEAVWGPARHAFQSFDVAY
jgi:acylphosphatase